MTDAPLPVWLRPDLDRLHQQFAQGRLPHALLLVGRGGDGLHRFADQLARLLLCTGPAPPCGNCKACQLLHGGAHPDRLVIEPEGKSATIRVAQVRELADFIHGTAQQGGNQVIRLTRADRMNNSAANALLKMLEEPTPNTYVLLEAESVSRLLPTVRSRCRLCRLARPSADQARAYLADQGVTEAVDDRLALTDQSPLAAADLDQAALDAWIERVRTFRRERGFSALAAFIGQQNAEPLLQQLLLWVDSAIQRQYGAAPALTRADAELSGALQPLPAVSLFAFRDYILELKRGLADQANLNQQLWSEQLAARWLDLTGAT